MRHKWLTFIFQMDMCRDWVCLIRCDDMEQELIYVPSPLKYPMFCQLPTQIKLSGKLLRNQNLNG